MKKSNKPFSIQLYAKISGVLYLSLLPLGIFGMIYVPAKLIVWEDGIATAQNLVAFELQCSASWLAG
jgi:hypothetical protein